MKSIQIGKDLINYLKPQERVVFAERTGFLQISRGREETETVYFARPREFASLSRVWRVLASLSNSKFLRILKLHQVDNNISPDYETANPQGTCGNQRERQLDGVRTVTAHSM